MTRVSKSEEGDPGVGWFGGGPCSRSGSRDLGVVLETLFRVFVIEGFDVWALFRAQLYWKAKEHGGSTVRGTGRKEGEGSLTCQRNWASSSTSWRIVVHKIKAFTFLDIEINKDLSHLLLNYVKVLELLYVG